MIFRVQNKGTIVLILLFISCCLFAKPAKGEMNSWYIVDSSKITRALQPKKFIDNYFHFLPYENKLFYKRCLRFEVGSNFNLKIGKRLYLLSGISFGRFGEFQRTGTCGGRSDSMDIYVNKLGVQFGLNYFYNFKKFGISAASYIGLSTAIFKVDLLSENDKFSPMPSGGYGHGCSPVTVNGYIPNPRYFYLRNCGSFNFAITLSYSINKEHSVFFQNRFMINEEFYTSRTSKRESENFNNTYYTTVSARYIPYYNFYKYGPFYYLPGVGYRFSF